jgi:predicted oxidoreductase (fatty acid repression mutant protein)
MVKKNSVLLEKQIYPKDDESFNESEENEEIIEKIKPKSKKQILPKNDNNDDTRKASAFALASGTASYDDQEKLINQLVDQMAQKKLKEK